MKHDSAVSAISFSPDGTKVATASFDDTARLWDTATGKRLRTMKHDEGVVITTLSFSPDGTKIATASGNVAGEKSDKTVRLWDAATGKPLSLPMKHVGPVSRIVFSRDGTKIATASANKTARVWHVPRSLPDDPAWIAAYALIVSGWKEDTDGTLRPISAEDAVAKWAEIAKSPTWLEYRKATLEASRRALHESEAAHWEAEKNWFAAAFHCRWLAKLEPDNPEWKQRLAKAEERLAALAKDKSKQEQRPADSGKAPTDSTEPGKK